MNEIEEQIKVYIKDGHKNGVHMYYTSWDLRGSKTGEIGFTILSDNEYAGYMGQVDEYGMVKKLEGNNRDNWLILSKCDFDKWLWGWDENLVNEAIDIIDYFYDKQDSMNFLLCIKVVKRLANTCESRIYNVAKLSTRLQYIKKYFESACTWYLFIIPQKTPQP